MKSATEIIREIVVQKRLSYPIDSKEWADFDKILEVVEDIEVGLYCRNCGNTGIGIIVYNDETKIKCGSCGMTTKTIKF